MKIGDMITLSNPHMSVNLINYGHNPPVGGIINLKELCIILEVAPPTTSVWGKVKLLGQRGSIGWTDDGLFYVVAEFI
jgi:hypothetical protein